MSSDRGSTTTLAHKRSQLDCAVEELGDSLLKQGTPYLAELVGRRH